MIYLKLANKPKTLEELFSNLFSYLIASQLKSSETFSNSECSITECPPRKYRSVDDVIEISKTYFPRLSKKTILTKLLYCIIKIKDENNDEKYYYPYLIHCTDINRPTLCFSVYSQVPCLNSTWESGRMYRSKYKNWAQICGIVGINSEQELNNLHN